MSKNQRLAVFGFLLVLLLLLFAFEPTAPQTSGAISTLVFASLLLLAFSALLLEPFFTRPMDVIASGTSVLLLLAPSRDLLAPWGVWYWIVGGYVLTAVILATAALLLLAPEKSTNALQNRVSAILKVAVTHLAPGKAQYFTVFLLTLIFFVPPATPPFVALTLYAGLVVMLNPQRMSLLVSQAVRRKPDSVGTVFGVQGADSFLIRLNPFSGSGSVAIGDLLEFRYAMDAPNRIRRAIALQRFFLDDTLWISALCHPDVENRAAEVLPLPRHETGEVYVRSRELVSGFLDDVMGFVLHGSEIGMVRFQQVGRWQASEGDLVQVPCEGGAVLYQVVNAKVNREALSERNEADVVVGEAIQLGRWDPAESSFVRFGWVDLPGFFGPPVTGECRPAD